MQKKSLALFLETEAGIVMNYGMCRINKGASLKRADICPNLYLFTSTLFHTDFAQVKKLSTVYNQSEKAFWVQGDMV